MNQLKDKNHAYWIQRAPGYSEVNQEELSGEQNRKWSVFLEGQITQQLKNRKTDTIKALDIGAGPGFISIVLTRLGYSVTAFDFAETMIEQAKMNAGDLAERITYVQGDAQNLPFADESFDVIVSRNLTWNLEKPQRAYAEWCRVLKKDGLLMNFDANWYSYLFDEEKKNAYEQDRLNVADHQLTDYNVGENFDQMENIAEQLPLSKTLRPEWDRKCFVELGVDNVSCDVEVWKEVWTVGEQINFSSTPMFMVKAIKS